MRVKLLVIALSVFLCGCEERRKEYGFQFDIFCKDDVRASSYTQDKNGIITKMYPGFWSTMFVSYSGGLWMNGKFTPMEFREGRTITKFAPTVWVGGLPPKG